MIAGENLGSGENRQFEQEIDPDDTAELREFMRLYVIFS